jgi:hypothetical protein
MITQANFILAVSKEQRILSDAMETGYGDIAIVAKAQLLQRLRNLETISSDIALRFETLFIRPTKYRSFLAACEYGEPQR